MVNQCESSVTMEYSGKLSNNQIIKAEAYASLYTLGGYNTTTLYRKLLTNNAIQQIIKRRILTMIRRTRGVSQRLISRQMRKP